MTYNTREEVWEEELQNIMEDYLSHAEMRAFAKDPAEHMKEMREHWQVLRSFFHQELQKARHDWLREEIRAIEKRKYQNPKGQRAFVKNEAFNEILDRYQSELDQPIS